MNNNVVSLNHIRDGELNRLQFELLAFANTEHESLLTDVLDDFIDDENLLEEEEELLTFFLTVWTIFSIRSDHGQSIFSQFIEEKKKEKTLRSSTLNQLEAWDQTTASLSIITDIIDDLQLVVEDIFTNEKKQVKLTEKNEYLEVGGSLLGFLLPYGTDFTYFKVYLDFDANETPILSSEILDIFDESDYASHESFMMDAFPSVILSILAGEMGEGPDIDQLNWENPKYEAVANLYNEKNEEEELPKQFRDLGITLWYIFCTKEKPDIRKPEVYASALHYFIDRKVPFLNFYTQADLAEIYQVSKGSLSKAYHQLEESLAGELADLYDFMEEDDDSYYLPDYDIDDFEEDDDEIDFEDLFTEDEESPFNKKRK
jgi:DNA-binding XRE family transcriptional regulator